MDWSGQIDVLQNALETIHKLFNRVIAWRSNAQCEWSTFVHAELMTDLWKSPFTKTCGKIAFKKTKERISLNQNN